MKKTVLAAIAAAVLVSGIALAGDLYHNTTAVRAISPVTASNNDNVVGEIVDRRGYGSVTYVITTATIVDNVAVLTPTLAHCALDNCADAAAVPADQLLGTVAGATFAGTEDDAVKTLGYAGTRRYTRLTVTPSSNTNGATFSAVVILGHPQYRPTR
jgi:hypothetical protein